MHRKHVAIVCIGPQFFICDCHFKLQCFDDLHSRDRLDGNRRTGYMVTAWNNSNGSFWNLPLFHGFDPKTTCTCWSLAVILPRTFPSVDDDFPRGRKKKKKKLASLIYACARLFIIVAIASSMQCVCRLSPPTFVQSFSVYSHISRPTKHGIVSQPFLEANVRVACNAQRLPAFSVAELVNNTTTGPVAWVIGQCTQYIGTRSWVHAHEESHSYPFVLKPAWVLCPVCASPD